MAMLLSSTSFAFAPAAPAVRSAAGVSSSVRMETQGDLEALANKLNPVVGFYDPLQLSKQEFWDNTNEETIAWIRHSEIKHGRVAMAAFVGYCIQANGIKFPWEPFASITAVTPPEQWDALPEAAKWQIILGVGFLEWWSEIRVDGTPHYMKGGKPGYFPDFDAAPDKLPHWVGRRVGKGPSSEEGQGRPHLPGCSPLPWGATALRGAPPVVPRRLREAGAR